MGDAKASTGLVKEGKSTAALMNRMKPQPVMLTMLSDQTLKLNLNNNGFPFKKEGPLSNN